MYLALNKEVVELVSRFFSLPFLSHKSVCAFGRFKYVSARVKWKSFADEPQHHVDDENHNVRVCALNERKKWTANLISRAKWEIVIATIRSATSKYRNEKSNQKHIQNAYDEFRVWMRHVAHKRFQIDNGLCDECVEKFVEFSFELLLSTFEVPCLRIESNRQK